MSRFQLSRRNSRGLRSPTPKIDLLAPSSDISSHDMAEAILNNFKVSSQVRKQLDRDAADRVNASIPLEYAWRLRNRKDKKRMNVTALCKALEKNVLERQIEDVALIHAELSKTKCFDSFKLSPEHEVEMCKVVSLHTVSEVGMYVGREGEQIDQFYIIIQGRVQVQSAAEGTIKILHQGDSFGNDSAACSKTSMFDYIVEQPCTFCLMSSRNYCNRILPLHFEGYHRKEREFRSIAAFSEWEEKKISDLVQITYIRRYDVGSAIIREGKVYNDIMIIIRGFCEIWKVIEDEDFLCETLAAGDTLDLEHVLSEEPCTYTAVATSIVELLAVNCHEAIATREEENDSIIDRETMQKLLEREKKPAFKGFDQFAEKQRVWREYKSSVVQHAVREVRGLKIPQREKEHVIGRKDSDAWTSLTPFGRTASSEHNEPPVSPTTAFRRRNKILKNFLFGSEEGSGSGEEASRGRRESSESNVSRQTWQQRARQQKFVYSQPIMTIAGPVYPPPRIVYRKQASSRRGLDVVI